MHFALTQDLFEGAWKIDIGCVILPSSDGLARHTNRMGQLLSAESGAQAPGPQ